MSLGTDVDPRLLRREALLDAADQVVQRDGAAASMASIAAEAGITKPILYRHFGDKSGLYAALAERHTDRLLAALQAALSRGRTRRERFALTVDTYLATIEAEPQVYRFLVRPLEAAPVSGQVRSFLARLASVLAEGIGAELHVPDGDVAGQLRAQVWAHAVVGMVQAGGDWWLEQRACPRAVLTAELTELAWGGFAAER